MVGRERTNADGVGEEAVIPSGANSGKPGWRNGILLHQPEQKSVSFSACLLLLSKLLRLTILLIISDASCIKFVLIYSTKQSSLCVFLPLYFSELSVICEEAASHPSAAVPNTMSSSSSNPAEPTFDPKLILSTLSNHYDLSQFETKQPLAPNPQNALFQSLKLPNPNNEKEPQVKRYKIPSPAVYHSYHSDGISFEFLPESGNDSDTAKLHTIIIYNHHQGFLPFQHALPLGMNMKMKNIDIIQKFREPKNKGGGGQAPIWIEYHVKELLKKGILKKNQIPTDKNYGVMIEFKKNSWEDLENPIACIYFFEVDE